MPRILKRDSITWNTAANKADALKKSDDKYKTNLELDRVVGLAEREPYFESSSDSIKLAACTPKKVQINKNHQKLTSKLPELNGQHLHAANYVCEGGGSENLLNELEFESIEISKNFKVSSKD